MPDHFMGERKREVRRDAHRAGMLRSHDDETCIDIGSETQDGAAYVPWPKDDLGRNWEFLRCGEERHFRASSVEHIVAVVKRRLCELGHDMHDGYASTVVGGERGDIRQGVRRTGGVDRAEDFE